MNHKFFISSLAILFSPALYSAESLPNCVGSDLSMQGANEETCVSTCTDIASYAPAQLSSGSSGFCVGDATQSKFTLYEVKLGVSAQAEATCNLWSGNFLVDKAQYASGQQVEVGGAFGYCSPGTYDVVYVTTSRNETFAGSATFPDGSGKIAKTTSTFSSDSDSYDDVTTWLETSTSHSDNDLSYVRPTSGWNSAFKKLSSVPSDTDLSSSSAAEMTFDWAKMQVINKVTGGLSGWYCEDGATDVCERINSAGYLEGRYLNTVDGVYFPSGGLVVTDTIQPNWNLSYFGLNTSTERGLRFLWHHDGTSLKYLGANPGESGLEITISTIEISGGE
jgi:hypothetical protein